MGSGDPVSFDMDSFYMRCALRQALKARNAEEVPVGAVVVSSGCVIGEGWNQTILSMDPTAHAEIVALRRAAERVRNYRLPEATLYVTAEPCLMCLGAILNARVRRLVFGCRVPKTGAVRSAGPMGEAARAAGLEVTEGICAEEAYELLKQFFAERRGA